MVSVDGVPFVDWVAPPLTSKWVNSADVSCPNVAAATLNPGVEPPAGDAYTRQPVTSYDELLERPDTTISESMVTVVSLVRDSLDAFVTVVHAPPKRDERVTADGADDEPDVLARTVLLAMLSNFDGEIAADAFTIAFVTVA